MAKTTFNAKDFLEKKSYPTIQAGEYQVTLGKVRVGAEDPDNIYIVLPITLDNGRPIDVRYYGQGIEIVLNQLRRATANREVYDSNLDFFKSLEGKQVKCYVSNRSYEDREGNKQNTLQYDFIQRKPATVSTTEETVDDEDLIV